MEAYSQTLQTLLHYEGVYSNDTHDRGGETCYGISRKYHPEWDAWNTIDHLKSQAEFPASISRSTRIQAAVAQFYLEHYWKPLQSAAIAEPAMRTALFLFSVHAGIVTAVKLLQQQLRCEEDGIMGPQTLAAIHAQADQYILERYQQAQIRYYMHLCQAQATQHVYVYGWIKRVLFL